MKIAIDCRMIGSGGIGTFVHELIPYFLENNECLLIGKHEQCMDFVRLQNVEFCFCEVETFSIKEMFFFPDEVVQKINSCDVYFSPYCNIPGGIRIPIFSTIHDVVFLDVEGLTGKFGRLTRKFIYQRAINKSKMLFTVSEFSKERIEKNLTCNKNISIIYNSAPVYLTKIDEKENEIEAENSKLIETAKKSILFVGNIKKHKGLKTLLKAFNLLKENNSDSKLLIVGNKDNFRTEDEETTQFLTEMQNEDIVFTGKISDLVLKSLYKNAKVLVQPSLYEGFGIPPLEAMTMGTVAIISDIEVFKEIYCEFPVIYFKAEDENDLSKKLSDFLKEPKKIELSDNLKEKYSYKKSAQIILEQMKLHLK